MVVVRQPVVYQQPSVVYQQPVAAPARPAAVAADPAVTPQSDAERAAVREALKKVRGGTELKAKSPAKVIVRLPSDARLYVDNVLCTLNSGTRTFDTPALEPGRKYFYTLRAEMTQDGQRVEQSQRVILTAGQRINVQFNNLATVSTAQQD